MSELRCQYSGAPMQVARPHEGRLYYCCTGCALAAGVPVDAKGDFPINRVLIAALGVGLAFFNQGLFWLLAALLAGEGRVVVAGRFTVASLALGLALWLLLAVVQWRVTGSGGTADRLVVALTAALLALGLAMVSPGCAVAAVGLLAAWGARGLVRRG